MYKKHSIKSLVYFSIALILIILIPIQIFFYAIIHKQNVTFREELFESIAQHTNSQIQNLNRDISEIAFSLSVNSTTQSNLYDYSPSEFIKNMSLFKILLHEYKERNNNICNLAIIKDGSILISEGTISFFDEINAILKKTEEINIDSGYFSSPFYIDSKTYFAYAIPVHPIHDRNFPQRGRQNYVICIYEIKEPVSNIFSNIDNHSVSVRITDSDNIVLLSPNEEEIGKQAPPLSNEYLAHTFNLSENNWRLSVYLPKESISFLTEYLTFFLCLLLFLSIFALFIVIHLLNHTIIKRVNLLKENIALLPLEATNHIISYNYDDEFGEIVAVFNQLLKKINILNEEKVSANDKLFNAQLLQKETQLFYLYGQMSPHFLYNSMACIHGAAYKYNATDVIELTASLSQIFRYFSNSKNFSTIKEDLDFAIEYFNVINSRRIVPIDISCNIDTELYDVKCLKMIYQPILENALKHAFEPGAMGKVSIISVADDKYAIIEICDDGKGFCKEFLDEFNKIIPSDETIRFQNSENVGIMNVHLRLKLFYDESCGISIYSEKNKGSRVRITFNKMLPEKPLFFENKYNNNKNI